MASARTALRARQLGAIIAFACIVTPVFNVVTNGPSFREAVQGVVDAIVVGVLVGGYLLFARDEWLRPWFRRLRFWQDLALSSAIVLALFLVGRGVGQVLTHQELQRLWTSFTERHLLYALPFFVVLAVAIQFTLQVNRVIGATVLRYFFAGVYHRPRAEERVFLFVDLEGSTQIAERLGSRRYFELLRFLVDDLTEPVLDAEGEIYQYAGDEVVITWPVATGVRDANCVRCYFAIGAAIARQAARYEREFGVVPRLRGGLHAGTVTAGELGDIRRQIVYVGDILNTAARLEEYAKRNGLELVVSDALLAQLRLPAGLQSVRCGELELRGKDARVVAFGVSGLRSGA